MERIPVRLRHHTRTIQADTRQRRHRVGRGRPHHGPHTRSYRGGQEPRHTPNGTRGESHCRERDTRNLGDRVGRTLYRRPHGLHHREQRQDHHDPPHPSHAHIGRHRRRTGRKRGQEPRAPGSPRPARGICHRAVELPA